MKLALIALLLSLSPVAHAQWSTDGEAGIVNTTGNSRAQSYSVKDKTGYVYEKDTYTFTGSYLQSQANGVQTAKNFPQPSPLRSIDRFVVGNELL